jgi:hypothetical protein
MRRLSDAQHETLAEQCDFDVRKINGWRSLPIVESWVFARCAVCVRCVCGVCGRVRSCALLCAAVRRRMESLPSQIGATSKLMQSVELANDVGAPC